jgi:hypothetical protein
MTKEQRPWTWFVAVSDWPVGKAPYDLTPAEALRAVTGRACRLTDEGLSE